jgi:hypothetical protein
VRRPATGADLPKGEFSRKPAYENSKGEKSPWSPVVEAVIA